MPCLTDNTIVPPQDRFLTMLNSRGGKGGLRTPRDLLHRVIQRRSKGKRKGKGACGIAIDTSNEGLLSVVVSRTRLEEHEGNNRGPFLLKNIWVTRRRFGVSKIVVGTPSTCGPIFTAASARDSGEDRSLIVRGAPVKAVTKCSVR